MRQELGELVAECEKKLLECDGEVRLQEIKAEYLGKNGKLTALLKGIKELPPEERPAAGAHINKARNTLEVLFGGKADEIKRTKIQRSVAGESADVSLRSAPELGTLHPITLITREISDMLVPMGFEVIEGPEVEKEYYNFNALNIPADHPARDMQDTFYITEDILLRTHTSPMQARLMEKKQPPIKMICPGKTFRSDSDATHSPVFHQIEGLVVDEHVTLCDLKGTLEYIAKKLFSPSTSVRFRPSYFPFTEPSVEVDLSCSNCGGKGCSLCKGTGWIEVLGAGMVNPRVLENCGIDSEKYTGYAFGMGIERVAIIKYGIPDIRLFYENDVRFLKQFKRR